LWRIVVLYVVLILPVALVTADAGAQDAQEMAAPESRYDLSGWFLRAGAAAAFFDEAAGDIQFDPGVGLSVAGGYRHNAYLAGEFSFAYFWKSDTDDFLKFDEIQFDEDDPTKKLISYEISANLKFYPLGYVASDDVGTWFEPLSESLAVVPDWWQPYLSFGLGFSQQDVSELDQTRFALRFVGGMDFLITRHYGLYAEGGYTMHTNVVHKSEGTYLDGTGHIHLGALVRF